VISFRCYMCSGPGTELNFALLPYHPAGQAPGTAEAQVRLIDAALAASPGGRRDWVVHRVRHGAGPPGRGSRSYWTCTGRSSWGLSVSASWTRDLMSSLR
jgi:hypothetical protein